MRAAQRNPDLVGQDAAGIAVVDEIAVDHLDAIFLEVVVNVVADEYVEKHEIGLQGEAVSCEIEPLLPGVVARHPGVDHFNRRGRRALLQDAFEDFRK
jgi:hypothetical protein